MREFSRARVVPAACAVLLTFAAVSAEAATITWTTWISGTPGATTGSALGTLPGTDVTVTYAGQFVAFDDDLNWLPATSFTGGLVGNAPPSGPGIDHDGIAITGGLSTGTNTITFSAPVVNPIVAIWSLGQSGLQAQFDFSTPFLIKGGGPNSEFGGSPIFEGGPCPANVLCGIEGNGVVQLPGRHTQISWTNPVFEHYYAFTVGALATAPEPATLVLLGVGLSFVAFHQRRSLRHRRQK